MTWGTQVNWKVGDRAKWFGKMPVPMGATWNPPPPGWKPPTPEEIEQSRLTWRDMHVTIIDLGLSRDGSVIPTLARADDGFEFDPSIHIWCLVSASHPGWLHPDPDRGLMGYR